MIGRRAIHALATAAMAAAACGGPAATPHEFTWADSRLPRTVVEPPAVRLLWTKRLTDEFDQPFVPVEHASAGLDPVHDRVYVGSAQGGFFAFSSRGRPFYRYDPRSGVEAAPAVDRRYGDVFLASEDGVVHALRGRSGEVRWKESAGGPVRRAPALAADAVYVVTENDRVVALSREDGELLWSYDRETDVEYAIAGHAGLTLWEGKVLAGFTDGAVVALDAADGSVEWERPTSLDYDGEENEALRFFDVDTTPVVIDDTLYVASFSTGIYALDPNNGSVRWRLPRRGVTALAVAGPLLIVSSAEEGVVAIDRHRREDVWRRAVDRGAPGPPHVTPLGVVLVGESRGALLALDARSGAEVGRIDAGTGFSGPIAVAGRLGFALSNGGTLMAFGL